MACSHWMLVMSSASWPLVLLSPWLGKHPSAPLLHPLLPFTAGCLLHVAAVEVWGSSFWHLRPWLLLYAQVLCYYLQPEGPPTVLLVLTGLLCLTRLVGGFRTALLWDWVAEGEDPWRQYWLLVLETGLSLLIFGGDVSVHPAFAAGFASCQAFRTLPPDQTLWQHHRWHVLGLAGYLIAFQLCLSALFPSLEVFVTLLLITYSLRHFLTLLDLHVQAVDWLAESEKPGRLAPAVLARLHRCRARALSDGRCAICLETAAAAVLRLPCSHAFHARCVEAWLAKAATCPVCVTPVQLPEPACPRCGRARRSRHYRLGS